MTLTAEILQDDLAVTLARIMAAANKRASEAGIDVHQSLISITQLYREDDFVWRVNYGPKEYIGRRGGDLMVEVEPRRGTVLKVLRGQ